MAREVGDIQFKGLILGWRYSFTECQFILCKPLKRIFHDILHLILKIVANW